MQQLLAEPKWAEKLAEADRRALSPLFWTHVNLYGRFELDMNSRLDLDLATAAPATVPGPRSRQGAAAPALSCERNDGRVSAGAAVGVNREARSSLTLWAYLRWYGAAVKGLPSPLRPLGQQRHHPPARVPPRS
jgi:hypothetical protein